MGTWNVRGLTEAGRCSVMKFRAVVRELEEEGVEVAAICETWFQNEETVEEARRWAREGGWEWTDHRRTVVDKKEKKGSGGVALLVRTKSGVEVVGREDGGEGVLGVRVKKGGVTLTVVAVYAVPKVPRAGKASRGVAERLERTEEALEGLVATAWRARRRQEQVVVLGDLNARVGEEGVQLGMGAGPGEFVQRASMDKVVNPRGTDMLRRCGEAGLVMMNGLKGMAEYTRVVSEEADSRGSSVCDWICVSEGLFRGAASVKVGGRDDTGQVAVGADHLLVSSTITLAGGNRKDGEQAARVTWALDDGGSEAYWDRLKDECEAMADREKEGEEEGRVETVENRWRRFVKDVHGCLERGVGRRKRRRRERQKKDNAKVRDAKAKVLGARERARREGRGTEGWREYRRLQRRLRKEARRKQWNDSMQEWEAFERKENMSEAEYWRRLKAMAGKGKAAKALPEKMKNAAGVECEGEAAEEVWTSGWRELGVEDMKDARFDIAFAEGVSGRVRQLEEGDGREGGVGGGGLQADIDLKEVKEAIGRLVNGKAQGRDSVPNEVYKVAQKGFVAMVRDLLQFIWEKEKVPQDWADGLVVPLHKDGDAQQTGNYRGISLLCTLGKVFCSILDARIKKFCEEVDPDGNGEEPRLSEEQGGFRPGRGCPDQIFTLVEVLKMRSDQGKDTYSCFIDVSKAYDRVFRDGLWEKLWRFGVRGRMWRVIKALYKNTRSSMLVNGKKLEEFGVEVGVRQGCVLSPTLFSIFFDGLVKHLKAAGVGVQYHGPGGGGDGGLDGAGAGKGSSGGGGDASRERVCCLFYADDIVLLAETEEELRQLLGRVAEYSEKWRFSLSLKKTQVVCFGGGAGRVQGEFEHRGEKLEVVDWYKYLGMEVEERLRGWKTFKKRVLAKATKVMRASWGMGLQNGHMSAAGGQKMWKAFTRPILEYGAEVWETEDDNAWKEAEAVQLEMGRKILRCGGKKTSKVSAAFVNGELGWMPLRARRVMLRLRYWGKLERMPDDRLAKKVYKESRRRTDDGTMSRSWCSYTRLLLQKVGLGEYWEADGGRRGELKDEAGWKRLVGKAVEDWSEREWRARVEDNGILARTYAGLRTRRGREMAGYLQYDKDPIGRKWWARLRSGVHGLAVHVGRWRKIPYEQRRCEYCFDWCEDKDETFRTTNEVENEEHLVLRCGKYRKERKDMWNDLGGWTERYQGTELFQHLIGDGPPGEDEEGRRSRCKAVMKFLRRVWKEREDEDYRWGGV